MLSRLILTAFLLWPSRARAEDFEAVRERTKRESRAVLVAILRDAEIEPTPCRFDVQWSRDSISADIARRYLGSPLFADVVASHLAFRPDDLIDPEGTMRGSFCAKNEADALWRQLKDDFRSGALLGEPDLYNGKPVSPPRLRFRRTKIAMPVFDRSFKIAAVVVSTVNTMMWRTDADAARRHPMMFDEAGYPRRGSVEGVGYTAVYQKHKGRWTLIDQNQDWTMH